MGSLQRIQYRGNRAIEASETFPSGLKARGRILILFNNYIIFNGQKSLCPQSRLYAAQAPARAGAKGLCGGLVRLAPHMILSTKPYAGPLCGPWPNFKTEHIARMPYAGCMPCFMRRFMRGSHDVLVIWRVSTSWILPRNDAYPGLYAHQAPLNNRRAYAAQSFAYSSSREKALCA